MAYLQDSDYFGFIDNAIQLNTGSKGIYFYSVYKTHKDDNPDFIKRLDLLVNELKEKIDIAKYEGIADKSENEMLLIGSQLTDFTNSYDWDNHTFYFQGGRVSHNLWFPNDTDFSYSEVSKLIMGLFELEKMIKPLETKSEQLKPKGVKLLLDEKTGQKNHMYYLLNQLKKMGIITNTYDQLANFLIENVNKFEGDNLQTILKELKDGNAPKRGNDLTGVLNKIKEV